MKITLLVYGALQPILGQERLVYDCPADDVRGLLDSLSDRFPDFARWRDRVACAAGDRIIREAELLKAGDEVALIPPVGGG